MRNAASFLIETIQSIQTQSFQDWELIIVNDHSTDKGPSLAKQEANKDYRILYFENGENGIIPALTLALEKASGTYISRMDADDIMPPRRLSTMIEAISQAPSKTIVTGLVKYFSEKEISDGYKKYEKWINEINLNGLQWQNIYRECVIASPNWITRKNELKSLGGFNNLNYPEDYDLVFKWYKNDYQIITIPEVTLLWREHGARTSRNSDHYVQQAFFNMKVREFILNELTDRPLVLWGALDKGQLAASILNHLEINYIWMDMHKNDSFIGKQKIGYFKDIENIKSPQILISVYPEDKDRQRIKSYLGDQDLIEGKNFWYL